MAVVVILKLKIRIVFGNCNESERSENFFLYVCVCAKYECECDLGYVHRVFIFVLVTKIDHQGLSQPLSIHTHTHTQLRTYCVQFNDTKQLGSKLAIWSGLVPGGPALIAAKPLNSNNNKKIPIETFWHFYHAQPSRMLIDLDMRKIFRMRAADALHEMKKKRNKTENERLRQRTWDKRRPSLQLASVYVYVVATLYRVLIAIEFSVTRLRKAFLINPNQSQKPNLSSHK